MHRWNLLKKTGGNREETVGKFIEELKEEHQSIIDRLLKVKRLGVHTMEGRSELIEIKEILLMHLQKEDDRLYPALREVAGKDKNIKHFLDTFEGEMKKISAFSIAFFNKYSVDGGGIEFLRDFDKLRTSLEDRIQREESMLYEKYEELISMPGSVNAA